MIKPDMDKARRETNRWLILQCLECARPLGAGESLLLSALSDTIDITQRELRRELDYLQERELLELTGRDSHQWHARLNRHGVDVVEYTVPCEPGIARPQKYW
jgi:DNA-binding transcriptional ArsR family regulator